MSRRFWTDLEIGLLRLTYADYTTVAIAHVLGRPITQVYGKAKSLGLKKSQAYLTSPAGGRLDGSRGAGARFLKGHTPANKGTRRPGYAPGRMAETQFKKGLMSGAAQHNYVPIGATRLSKDGYLEIKTTDDHPVPARRWVSVHRLVWEAAHGPIPPKHIVVFRGGQRTNIREEITEERLECISLTENMRRNTLHNYPKEITRAIQLRGALNRRINNVEKQNNR